MATTMTVDTPRHPDHNPQVATARKQFEEAAQRAAASEARFQLLTRLLDPYSPGEPASELERLDAIQVYAQVRVEAARDAKAKLAAESRWRTCRESARNAAAARYAALKKPVVAQLAAALQDAALLNDQLADLEAAENAACGTNSEGVAWPELKTPTPLQGSRFQEWLAAARSLGLLD